MSDISILKSEEADTCTQDNFEAFLTEVDRWLGVYLKVEMTMPQRASPLKLWKAVETTIRRNSLRAHLGKLLHLAGAQSVEPDADGFYVVWPGATPWRVVVSELDLIPTGGEALSLVSIAEEATGCHVAVVSMELFKHIRQDDVSRAADIERRSKLSKRRGGMEFTADDVFLEDLRIRVLRALQRALEESPTARLLKSIGMPMTHATDDELLSDGPSLGQDEEHFLSALDADLYSSWQRVEQ